jgi:hypothetical protein
VLALKPPIPSRMMIGPIKGTTRVKLQASIEESIAAGLLLMNEVWNNTKIYVANELLLLCWRTTVC